MRPSLLPIAGMSTENRTATPAVAPAVPIAVRVQDPSTVVIDGEFNMLPVPPAMTQTIVSATGGGALQKNAYFGNEDIFNSTPTNNGSGADSVSNTYGDGWAGKGYNKLMTAGAGIKCYGLTLQYITTSTGAQNPSGINIANPTVLAANLVGANQIPRGLVTAAGFRNTQYLAGTMTISYTFYLNCLCQLQYAIPVGNTVNLTVLTQPFQ